ncbi:SIMPL domain-containing protein [Mesorhizobium sp. NBSH29]|uniref:SIMPL domain-containing protein n=1 Tax=Mesorhizobium sp. NBSH29 TaxID=2654249 RepID=UPI0018964D64|nr:SIMPL domain-containing protein [Mesorhizobium sp. NBSH29]
MNRTFLPLALALSVAAPALATAADQPPPPRIMVVGEGESSIAPDMALLSLSVMREAATAREALTSNNDAMASVIAAMQTAGIAERDLQTAGIQINPRYDYTPKPDGSQEAKLVAYQVTNTLSVRVRDLAKTGEILDKAVSLGINQGGGISFTNEDASSVKSEARKLAVADAVAKARELTEAAGVKLGKVLEISETSYAQPPMPMMQKYEMRGGAADSVPVQAGENAYRIQVNVTFEIN